MNAARARSLFPGLAVATIVAGVAVMVGPFAPLLGAPVIAIVFGVALRAIGPLPDRMRPGIAFAARAVLQLAIVVSGLGISLGSVYVTGVRTLPVTLGTIAVALGIAPVVGRALRLDVKLRELIGVGTAICGASAIAALSSVIEPAESDVALAIATIFSYNIVAVVTFPALGHLLGMTQAQFGVWAGTAINDTSSVVAAGYAYGHDAGAQATIVKLTRATLILPIVAVVALQRARAERTAGRTVAWRKIVPWFIVWFLVAALAGSVPGLVPFAWHGEIVAVSTFLIAVALAAIGLQTAVSSLLGAGFRPLALGFVLWVAVALSSLGIQRLAGL